MMRRVRSGLVAVVGALATVIVLLPVTAPAASAADPCNPVVSVIACENSKPGTPESVWDISGSGDSTIQGFATDMSVNVGQTESFKIKTSAPYSIDIYRLGWYGGDGARLITSVTPTPRTQPACGTIPNATGSSPAPLDCGNWAVSASWAVPSTAVSGVYIARLTRTDTGGASHIVFVVRNDASRSDILMQTSDTTWQAYNSYGGTDFYIPTTFNTQAYKVSYNRPILTRDVGNGRDFLFSNEYPMIRFLERNGYDVSYFSGVDTARYGSLILNHKVFMSVGHDEYWSGTQRANVEAARDAGVNLAFFSGNESYWKTRWEPSYDGTSTANRTLVCYKETWANAKIDPSSEWTGTWRDPRFATPPNGGYPENAMSGTMYQSNTGGFAIEVPYGYSKARIWRNTSVASTAPGGTATLAPNTLGYEFDTDMDNGFRPAGLVDLSHNVEQVDQKMLDYGSTVGPGTVVHSLTQYRAPSGALVFSVGSIQWAWGLDSSHDGVTTGDPNVDMQQATVNVLADMGARPTTLASPGVVAASPSADTTAPKAVITSPKAGTTIPQDAAVTITGTATDVGGVVAGVEVSTDGGSTWHPAAPGTSGFGTWTYSWTPSAPGSVSLMARATDDSSNTGNAASAAVTVASRTCPCTVFGSAVPVNGMDPDSSSVELGVRFSSSVSGFVTGVRFYKGGAANGGTHTGSLWSSAGSLLATATFSGETSSGWQTVTFASPVAVTAGTTYVASYLAPQGRYAGDGGFFSSPFVNSPLTAAGSVYRYGSGGVFPTSTYNNSNYWVDVVFTTSAAADTTPPSVVSTVPGLGASGVATSSAVSVTLSEPIQAGASMTVTPQGGSAVAGSTGLNGAGTVLTFTPSAALAASTQYSVVVSGVKDLAGNAMASYSWSFSTSAAADTTPPSVVSTVPGLGASGVATSSAVSVTLSEPIQAGASMTVTPQGGSAVAGSTGLNGAGTVLTFTPSAALAASTQYSVVVSGVKDLAGNAMASYSWSFSTSAAADTTPPSVVSTVPGLGASGVATSSAVSVTLSEPIQAGASMTVTPQGGSAVAGSTGLNGAGTVLTFTPSAALAASTQYSVVVSGVKDLAGNAMASYSWSFTTAAGSASPCPSGSPCTVFGSAVPVNGMDPDSSSVELGVRFSSSVSGFVTGVRFYKGGAANGGTHTGSLWSSAGSLLATATFSGETSSGWQTVTFASPVAVTAGTTYVASYLAPQGRYAGDGGFFSSPFVNSPLTAAGSVYRYGSGGVFPTSTYNNSNYWVDVVFTTSAAADTTPPSVVSTVPGLGASGVATSSAVSVTLSEPIQAGASMTVTPQGGSAVAGSTGLNGAGTVLTFTPSAALAASTQYSVVVSGVKDLAGNAMASYSWSFTTAAGSASPCPSGSPCTVFGSAVPVNGMDPDSSSVELGVRFSSSVSGFVTGVRFYKGGAANGGTHTGSLWSSAGSLLATATFSGETSSGWQTVTFASPVAVTAGTTYVASYLAPQGRYAGDGGFFSSPFVNSPLTAAGSVYRYGSGGVFPTSTYNNSNYWVDVLFTTAP